MSPPTFETCPTCGEQKGGALYLMSRYVEDVAWLVHRQHAWFLLGIALGASVEFLVGVVLVAKGVLP